MNSQEILDRVEQINFAYSQSKAEENTLEVQLISAKSKLEDLKKQQEMIETAKVALEQARPLLSSASIKQLEELANTAIASIFELDAKVTYDVESKRFVIETAEGIADLVESNGGGLNTVISFVFDLFLLVKSGCRRFMTYDESFMAVSDRYFQAFVSFMVQACHDLNVDLLCISHDARLTVDMVDHAYLIESGESKKIK